MTREQKVAVIGWLREGYGVEDIAIIENIPVAEIREQVVTWREKNLMTAIFDTVHPDGNLRALEAMGACAGAPVPGGDAA